MCEIIKSKNILQPDILQVICCSFDLIMLAVWIWVIKPDWVKVVADSYADRLLLATETLNKD
jgi:hypothetical protein